VAEYHVGCGAFAIYAGTLNKSKTMWLNKTECTDEAMSAVAQYILENDKAMKFGYNGKTYRLEVNEVTDNG